MKKTLTAAEEAVFKLDARSERALQGVHQDMQRLMRTARARGLNFIITEGLRTRERQRQLVAAGASRTMNSRHLHGLAVDIAVRVGAEVRWDFPLYERMGDLIKDIAEELNIPVVWGGDWPRFRDGPHFELKREHYPDPR